MVTVGLLGLAVAALKAAAVTVAKAPAFGGSAGRLIKSGMPILIIRFAVQASAIIR